MQDRVFISYRRSDAQVAVEHLIPRLIEQFGPGQIYRDLDSNRPGFDFAQEIDEALNTSAVVLVFIGAQWVTATDKVGRRRLDDPDDVTRREVEQALRNEKLVIPVLVDSAEMPPETELPPSLRPLVKSHAIRLRSTDWNYDAERIIEHLERNGVRPEPREEYAGTEVKVHRPTKIYEREYIATRARAYDALGATLRALDYPVVADYAERYEIRFFWGNKQKAAGRAVVALYRRLEPNGVRATVLNIRSGRSKIIIENPSIAGALTPLLMMPLYGYAAGRGTRTLERKIIQDFFDQIQQFLQGRSVSKDPVALLGNGLIGWRERRRRK
jgi:hypothetical protein